MPDNLSIKNAPDHIVARLKERAAKHHRSFQGELMAIIEEAVLMPRPLTPNDVLDEVRRLGLQTPAEAAAIVRTNRDGHLKSSMPLRQPRCCLASRKRKLWLSD
jgi:antitoxin FitA